MCDGNSGEIRGGSSAEVGDTGQTLYLFYSGKEERIRVSIPALPKRNVKSWVNYLFLYKNSFISQRTAPGETQSFLGDPALYYFCLD